MEKRNLIIGIIGLALIILSLFLIFKLLGNEEGDKEKKILKAESELEAKGIKKLSVLNPKYHEMDVNFYYNEKICLENFNNAARLFDESLRVITTDKIEKIKETNLTNQNWALENEGPVLILSGDAQLYDKSGNVLGQGARFKNVISGVYACSEKLIAHSICSALLEKPQACLSLAFKESQARPESDSLQNSVCHKTCAITYQSGEDSLTTKIHQGQPCEKIDAFLEGQSAELPMSCHEGSCKSNNKDLGCCKINECVLEGQCYELNSAQDVDSDGKLETCLLSTVNAPIGIWANPDIDSSTCNSAGFTWFNCILPNQCKGGINDYDKSNNELCCGDDEDENSLKCKGKLCISENDFACCGENSCAFEGKCYHLGCNKIKLAAGEKISAYCNGETNTWEDLDDSHCSECISKKSWSGTTCCGDDAGENRHPVRFTFDGANESDPFIYYGCAERKSECVHPNSIDSLAEGFYYFKETANYLQGSYYCENSRWNRVNNSEEYCKKSKFAWDDNTNSCCGDVSGEFFKEGKDGTSACCSLETYLVEKGICSNSELCGNNEIDQGESCETPDSKGNEYCNQNEYECLGKELGLREQKGYCDNNCMCEETNYTYSCSKGSCGAECGSDSDCGESMRCDLDSCGCVIKTECGDGIVQAYNDIGQREECEPANTLKNPKCGSDSCRDKKSIIRELSQDKYFYGSCDDGCRCDFGEIKYGCQKNICGAECNSNGTGCADGLVCNTDTCGCFSLDVCGNGICEGPERETCKRDCISSECARRIELELNKRNYYTNDTFILRVSAYDSNNAIIPELKFELDIVINDALIGSSDFITDSDGEYIITKKITDSAASGKHLYIAKSGGDGCDLISDNELGFVQVNNIYTIPPNNFSFNSFDFLIDDFKNTYKDSTPICGDGAVGLGESCEGENPCRPSIGCDYENYIYDISDNCNNCGCEEDKKSNPSDELYCSNCNNCGDGILNCQEKCENGNFTIGLACKNGDLYNRVDTCSGCQFVDDGLIGDSIIDTCECSCPPNPKVNCIDGDYIDYTQDYDAGCNGIQCNKCSCVDTYSIDINKNRIDDKCEPEICKNKIDDNDDGRTDEKECIWRDCSQCGLGLLNFCTRQECAKFDESCYFNSFGYKLFSQDNSTLGECIRCESETTCEDYSSGNQTCILNACALEGCSWIDDNCCTDSDKDNVCDSIDNCKNVSNPSQSDADKDGTGDLCDFCQGEYYLTKPSQNSESFCEDGVDNDCDGLKDCMDKDCSGKGPCCKSLSDCEQSACAKEACVNNKCEYQYRYLCDNSECPDGQYCDTDGECSEPDESQNICLYCANDITLGDYGIGFGGLFSELILNNENWNTLNNRCCGDDPDEYYIVQNDNYQSACCNSKDACVDKLGNCQNSSLPSINGQEIGCLSNRWHECSQENNNLCSEYGSLSKYPKSHSSFGESRWYCTYDTQGFGWRNKIPKEICGDGFDNDCDTKVDDDDEECGDLKRKLIIKK